MAGPGKIYGATVYVADHDHLAEAINEVEADGDTVEHVIYTGQVADHFKRQVWLMIRAGNPNTERG